MWKMTHSLRAEAGEAEGAPASDPVAGSNLWDDLLDEGAEQEAEVPEAEPEVEAAPVGDEPEAAPEPEVVAEVAPAEPTPVVETKPVAAAVPQAPPAQVPEAPAVVSQPPPAQPTVEQLNEWRQQAMAGLEQAYALSPDDASALQVEPEKVLPKMAASLHLQIYDQVMRAVAGMAPQVIAQTMQQQSAAQAAENAFYSKWEDLRPYQAQVTQVAQMWRQMYPQASLDEAIDGIGKAVKAMLGLQGVPVEAVPQASVPPPPAGPSSRTAAPRARKSSLSPEAAQFVSFADEILNEET